MYVHSIFHRDESKRNRGAESWSKTPGSKLIYEHRVRSRVIQQHLAQLGLKSLTTMLTRAPRGNQIPG